MSSFDPSNTPHDETEQLSSKSAAAIAAIAFGLTVIPLVLLYFLAKAVNPSFANGMALSQQNITKRLEPVAKFELIPVVKGPKSGQEVYEGLCTSCHATGTSGAPILGSADWAPRIAKGFDVLFDHATNGFNQMPAKGGNPKLSDLEIKRAIVYMTNKSGAQLPEPEVDEGDAKKEVEKQ